MSGTGTGARGTFELEVLPEPGLLTTVSLRALVRGRPVWPSPWPSPGLVVQADDLLSHLAERWADILSPWDPPEASREVRPAAARAAMEAAWPGKPAGAAEAEDLALEALEDAHDLSRCFGGMFGIAPLFVARLGSSLLVDTAEASHLLPFEDGMLGLARGGDALARRLAEADAGRWSPLLAAWAGRRGPR